MKQIFRGEIHDAYIKKFYLFIFSILTCILFFALSSFQQYAPLLAVFSTQGQSELILLQKVQEYCYDNIHFMKAFQKIVVLFYKGKSLYPLLYIMRGFSMPTTHLWCNRKQTFSGYCIWESCAGIELWNTLCFDSSKEHVAAVKAETSPSLSVAFIL